MPTFVYRQSTGAGCPALASEVSPWQAGSTTCTVAAANGTSRPNADSSSAARLRTLPGADAICAISAATARPFRGSSRVSAAVIYLLVTSSLT